MNYQTGLMIYSAIFASIYVTFLQDSYYENNKGNNIVKDLKELIANETNFEYSGKEISVFVE